MTLLIVLFILTFVAGFLDKGLIEKIQGVYRIYKYTNEKDKKSHLDNLMKEEVFDPVGRGDYNGLAVLMLLLPVTVVVWVLYMLPLKLAKAIK